MRALRPLILLLLLPTQQISAEYRVYQLRISNIATKQERLIVSTLDHIQYPDYYTLSPDESIEYVDSWMCWENTGNHQAPCKNPKALENRKLATQKPKTSP